MPLSKTFPRALAACSLLCLLAATVAAQTDMRPRHVNPETATDTNRFVPRLENEPFVVSQAPAASLPHSSSSSTASTVAPPAVEQLNQLMLAAIDARLGTPYRMGATGPNRFDCSGFVWSVFQSAGIDFERSSARTLWEQFAPATEQEKREFGTLVFFNNQHHVGIVADANGFYHASTSKGVVYSTFNDYWLERLDGFRRVPLPHTGALTVAINNASTK